MKALIATALCASLLWHSLLPAQAAKSDQSFALLVGINDYKMKPLSGAVNDVQDLHEVLVKVFNFSDDKKHIVELLDGAATKKRILEMFRTHLIENAKNNPDGMFVFQFSGHGTQVSDDKAHQDELDGLDEALVPGDVNGKVFKAPDQLRSALITDDELSVLLKELCQSTKNVIIITDSCRSGTNLRGSGHTSRFVEMKDLGLDVPKKRQPETLQNSDSFEKFEIPSDRYIAISGSDASHNAIETFQKVSEADDKFNGLMTANLLPLLKTSRSDITYRQLADRLRALVSGESAQNPQVEGDLDRYVFTDHSRRADAFIPVKKAEKEKVIIAGGTALGIEPGAIVSFYDKTAKQLRGKEGLLTTGSVISAAPFDCVVQLPAGTNSASLLEAKAIIASSQSATQRPIIYLDKSMSKLSGDESLKPFFEELKKEAERELSLDIRLEPVELWETKKAEKKWDLAICQRNFDLLYLVRPSGQTVQHSWINIMQANAAAEILGKARRTANQDMLRELFNETSTLNGKVPVTLWKAIATKDGKWTKGEQLAKTEATPHINIGERFIITVANNAQTPLYIGTISLATSGAIIPLYPKAAGANEALLPGQAKDLPVCKVGGPPGEETVKVIASTEPVDLTLLKQEGITRGDAKLGTIKSNSLQLQAILMRAAGTLSRGENPNISGSPSLSEDWTASSFNLIIDSIPQAQGGEKPRPVQ